MVEMEYLNKFYLEILCLKFNSFFYLNFKPYTLLYDYSVLMNF